MKMANEGLRPYWYDSSLFDNGSKFIIKFYYPANIDTITLLNRITHAETIITVGKEKEDEYLYIEKSSNIGVYTKGNFNDGNTVLFDQRQKKPIYSNRISKR